MKDKPQIGDIIINKDPYEGESYWIIIGKMKDGDFRCGQGTGRYNKTGIDYNYCKHMPEWSIIESYKNIGFICMN